MHSPQLRNQPNIEVTGLSCLQRSPSNGLKHVWKPNCNFIETILTLVHICIHLRHTRTHTPVICSCQVTTSSSGSSRQWWWPAMISALFLVHCSSSSSFSHNHLSFVVLPFCSAVLPSGMRLLTMLEPAQRGGMKPDWQLRCSDLSVRMSQVVKGRLWNAPALKTCNSKFKAGLICKCQLFGHQPKPLVAREAHF